ncbi:MAG: hypothetical protein EOS20_22180 [Mesorhizobium sp.]|uniref:hypothetical protein n=1 Tax=unclassified Mesorhizobium TaxID=325217 RepID=UPI000F74C8FA|nr:MULTISPECIES: hypothetical protein [unclassified Mesorhizobium]RUU15665.1 hypothetical protein EOD08_28700 [Mesorhizobium sp. M6A.T.Ca.TU.002.02.2.1]AZO67586.1 hypothetical protein EJ075_23470 [Mesorhizobium sp. M6A.T.Cr.TU.016.01.1.1]RUU28427.1 hypothetical protein EOC94_18425 [Mesorhizobium sp. M6A.T.Ce.TU.016.01.1.1]RVB74851.1 hypothetical protein EN885_21400 [Mesorhizobium sp. M6A.T.Cr.TU.014.01.1.1]RWP54444.1 MAG: hypothetical protein EOR06_10380 [Mesorhizobium sp.]
MAISRKEEARALSADEHALVEKSHHPAVQDLADAELSGLVKLLRERRDKAQGEAHRRRREIRGKGAPKGAAASKADGGSQLKLEVLAMAMRRLNGEAERRRQLAARVSLVDNARKALSMKQGAAADGPEFNTRTAHKGMRAVVNQRAPNLVRPMELGRQRKAAKVAQAKRDAR